MSYITDDKNAPIVYFTDAISPDSLLNIYSSLKTDAKGKVGVKLSTGEPPYSNYLRPSLIGKLVKSLNGTIVECNTAYKGERHRTKDHEKVIREHGFLDIAEVDIQDSDGDFTLPVKDGEVLDENYVGASFPNYDFYLVLSHFKGHAMAGFGGAIKNISIGFGSTAGKCYIHSGATSKKNPWRGDHNRFLMAMAEAAKSVSDFMKGNIVYINVLNRISIDCDCDGHPHEPEIKDIGITASLDPVAIDQACIDLVWDKEGSKSLRDRIESLNGMLTIEHAAKIGLGSRNYRLIEI